MSKQEILNLIKNRNFKSGVEIGSGRGDFTSLLSLIPSIEKVYCIDLWEDWDKNKFDNKIHYCCNDGTLSMDLFKEKLSDSRFEIIKGKSNVQISKISGDLDFCCVDGNLTADGLFKDLKESFLKVKNGGVIFGFKYGQNVDTDMYDNNTRARFRKNIKANTQNVLDLFSKYTESNLIVMSDGCWVLEKKRDNNYFRNKEISIEICIHCFRYQRRLSWMLSSILQQKGDLPKIKINISHCENDGNPTTREVCDFFSNLGLDIKQTIMSNNDVSNRAKARNVQVKESKSDWILFADSDLVYDEFFFDDINKKLRKDFLFETVCMGADRTSLDIPFCIKFFEEDNRQYPCVVESVADISKKWPIRVKTGGRLAPGNFQLASLFTIQVHGGFYSKKEQDLWRATRSDKTFRKHIGGVKNINAKPFYHLNHDRGGPDIQR